VLPTVNQHIAHSPFGVHGGDQETSEDGSPLKVT